MMNYSLRGKTPSVYQAPYRLLIIPVLSIFISEAFVMIFLSLLPPLPLWFEVLFDSALLVVLLFPMLYFFLFHPLVMHIAERRRAEEALAESEERYRKLVELSPEAIAVHSEGRIVFLNAAGAKLLGAAHPEQIIGKNIIDIVHPDYREVVRERVRQMREEGKIVPLIEEKFVRLDGSVIDAEVAAMPLTYQGKPAIQVVIRDITERKRIEDRLQLFRSLINQSNEAIFVDDPETGRILDANDKACSSLGYTRGELLKLRVFDLEAIIPDYLSWRRHVEEVRRKGYLILEGQNRRKDGTTFPVEVNVSHITIGEKSYMVAVARDITERKRMESALIESENRYRTIFETTGTATVIIEKDTTISLANTEFEKLTGYSKEEVEGKKKWTEFVVKEDLERMTGYHYARRIEPERAPNKYEFRLIDRYGNIRDIFLAIAVIPGTKQSIASLLDITERKRAEEALRRARDELEIRVQERTAELARSNAELEQFAYVASHDLQEPLRMISGFTQLLDRRYKGRLDKDADEFIGYIVDGAKRMQRIIEDLLAYSRVGTRGKPFEPTDLEAVFDQTLDNLKVAIEENNATITHDPLPTIMADVTQMIQLFQNLAGNAIKFRKKEEPPRIHVSARRKENEWLFSVRDNGIGISPEFKSRLFNIFQREHRASEYPGTGIGLAICKKIVERHGGRIWAESVQGEGSTFYFTIPVKRDESTARGSEALAG